MYVCMYVCMYVWTYIYTHIYIYIYIYVGSREHPGSAQPKTETQPTNTQILFRFPSARSLVQGFLKKSRALVAETNWLQI